jgi:hypothetical protein
MALIVEEGRSMFLVKFSEDPELFFTRRTKSSTLPLGTPYPGAARGFSYETAFLVTQKLKDLGYIAACVCLPNGQPATVEDIAAPPNLQATAEFALAWDAD